MCKPHPQHINHEVKDSSVILKPRNRHRQDF